MPYPCGVRGDAVFIRYPENILIGSGQSGEQETDNVNYSQELLGDGSGELAERRKLKLGCFQSSVGTEQAANRPRDRECDEKAGQSVCGFEEWKQSAGAEAVVEALECDSPAIWKEAFAPRHPYSGPSRAVRHIRNQERQSLVIGVLMLTPII
jgi:hypothetical protein